MKSFNELLSYTRDLYAALEKPDKALKHARELVDMAPDNYEVLNLLAAILYELDEDDEAFVYYNLASKIEPNSIEALEGLMSIANDNNDFTQALKLADRAIKAENNDPYLEFIENHEYHQRLMAQVYIEKGYALYKLGEIRKAKEVMLTDGVKACPLEEESLHEEWHLILEED